jgi:hypothetical protein
MEIERCESPRVIYRNMGFLNRLRDGVVAIKVPIGYDIRDNQLIIVQQREKSGQGKLKGPRALVAKVSNVVEDEDGSSQLVALSLVDSHISKRAIRDWQFNKKIEEMGTDPQLCVICGKPAVKLQRFKGKGHRPVCYEHGMRPGVLDGGFLWLLP